MQDQIVRYVSMTQDLRPGDILDIEYLRCKHGFRLYSGAGIRIFNTDDVKWAIVIDVDSRSYYRKGNLNDLDAIIEESGRGAHLGHNVSLITWEQIPVKIGLFSSMMLRVLS